MFLNYIIFVHVFPRSLIFVIRLHVAPSSQKSHIMVNGVILLGLHGTFLRFRVIV